MQPDSVIPDLSNPQAYNRYTYVLNSPIIYNDPTGHQWCGPDNIYCGGLPDDYSPPSPNSPSTPPGGGGGGGCSEDDDLCWMNNNDNDDCNLDCEPEIDWEGVAADLLRRADEIESSIGRNALEYLIMMGFSYATASAASSLGICPATGPATPYCVAAAMIGGFFGGVAVSSLVTNDAATYREIAITILDNLENGQLNLMIVHKPERIVHVEAPPGAPNYSTNVFVPETYALTNADGTYVAITPSTYEVLASIILSNTSGP